MRRHELTDEEWMAIEPLMPRNNRRGGQWKEHREILNGLFWRLRTGAPWRDIPERYGAWQTIYDRFNRWRKDGTFDKILSALQMRLDKAGLIDWDLWCVDGSNVRASRAAAGAGKKGAMKSRKTTLWAAQEADMGRSCTWLLTAKAYRSASKSAQGKRTSRSISRM